VIPRSFKRSRKHGNRRSSLGGVSCGTMRRSKAVLAPRVPFIARCTHFDQTKSTLDNFQQHDPTSGEIFARQQEQSWVRLRASANSTIAPSDIAGRECCEGDRLRTTPAALSALHPTASLAHRQQPPKSHHGRRQRHPHPAVAAARAQLALCRKTQTRRASWDCCQRRIHACAGRERSRQHTLSPGRTKRHTGSPQEV